MKNDPKMTRSHFNLIAATLHAAAADELTVKTFAGVLARTNPKFDRERFIKAATFVRQGQTEVTTNR